MVQKSREQQHAFNIPFQLSKLPGYQHLAILQEQNKLKEYKKLYYILKNKSQMC